MLTDLPPSMDDMIDFSARATDEYYSDSLGELLRIFWSDSPRTAVLRAAEAWAHNVRLQTIEMLEPDSLMPWDLMRITDKDRVTSRQSQQIDFTPDEEALTELIAAASEPEHPETHSAELEI